MTAAINLPGPRAQRWTAARRRATAFRPAAVTLRLAVLAAAVLLLAAARPGAARRQTDTDGGCSAGALTRSISGTDCHHDYQVVQSRQPSPSHQQPPPLPDTEAAAEPSAAASAATATAGDDDGSGAVKAAVAGAGRRGLSSRRNLQQGITRTVNVQTRRVEFKRVTEWGG